MFITKMSLPRRTFLQGVGAAIGLPFLEAMIPAFKASAASQPVRRFGAIYVPHGKMMKEWTPTTVGANFEFPTILKPLEPFRSQLTVVSSLSGPPIVANGGHAVAPAGYLSGHSPKQTEGEDINAAITIDQVIAKAIGQDTPLPSLELATEDFSTSLGACDTGYSCVYMNTISWAGPTSPLPMETNPRAAFERLFGKPGTPARRLARLQENRSILDSVSESVGRLRQTLGGRDQARLNDYLENVREIERRIQRAEKSAASDVTLPEAPIGPPEAYPDHVAMLFDLVHVAFQADLTRVFTFMMARDVSSRTFPQIGVPDPHHALSHESNRGNDPGKVVKFTKVNTYMVNMFADFVTKLAATTDGAGSLLDQSVVLYGSGMSNGNLHSHAPLPIAVLGGKACNVKGNRHITNPDLTPIENLHVSLAQRAGVEIETFGRSTSPIDI
jgi:Protein of unknown function (DUF1552)